MSLRGGLETGEKQVRGRQLEKLSRDRVRRASPAAAPAHAQSFSADELLALVEAGTDWIWETDHELRFSWLSGNYQDVTGIAPDSVLGRFRFDFLKQVSKGSANAEAHLADLEARRPFRNFVYELEGRRGRIAAGSRSPAIRGSTATAASSAIAASGAT